MAFLCDQPDVVHQHPINGQDIKRSCLRTVQESEAVCGELVGYLDDGAYSCGHKDPAILSDILTEKFDNLSAWIQNNKLVNNPDKNKFIGTRSKEI